ncbi:CBO0543 family protein [Sporomusa sp.]|uniref:CBO0543 family protein n=1 Tax=Sporomusa sp. TaxID=2078658 RepID=UPI002C4E234D|nr:CBO0543 family protein [Sporomusa sp.]HWR06150.1 CBO0543 family protein [Sporomusa sp.]
MEFYYIRFVLFWILWLIFADKSRWRELFAVGIFAGFLDGFADIFSFHYPLWKYHPPDSVVPNLFDNMGVYIVVSYLFIQWLPKNPSVVRMLMYWFLWTAFAIAIEWVHVHMGYMTYDSGWRMEYSYIADWIIYWMLYKFHKVFELRKLSV